METGRRYLARPTGTAWHLSLALSLVMGACAGPSASRSEAPEPQEVVDRCLAVERAEASGRREVRAQMQRVSRLVKTPVRRAMRRNGPRFYCCFREFSRRTGVRSGTVNLRIRFVDGRPTSSEVASISDRSLDDPTLHRCLAAVGSRVQIPEWFLDPDDAWDEGVGEVSVVYPLNFVEARDDGER